LLPGPLVVLLPEALVATTHVPLLATVPDPQVVGAGADEEAGFEVLEPHPLLLPQPIAVPSAAARQNADNLESFFIRPPSCGLSIV